MTERKPPGVSFETWVDKQIREAMERGDFDNLPGAGKPIPNLDRTDDELWWIRQKMRREGASSEDALPPSLRLRKEIERLPETVRPLPSERAVREAVEKLNKQILDWLLVPTGPQVLLTTVDADTVVAQWRAVRPPTAGSPTARETDMAPPRKRWWRRRRRA